MDSTHGANPGGACTQHSGMATEGGRCLICRPWTELERRARLDESGEAVATAIKTFEGSHPALMAEARAETRAEFERYDRQAAESLSLRPAPKNEAASSPLTIIVLDDRSTFAGLGDRGDQTVVLIEEATGEAKGYDLSGFVRDHLAEIATPKYAVALPTAVSLNALRDVEECFGLQDGKLWGEGYPDEALSKPARKLATPKLGL